MAYEVDISRQAQADADEAFVWKGELSFEAANHWYIGLMEALASLEELPTRCPLAPENDTFREEIRQLLYGKGRDIYRILFTIRRETVFILYIRHGAREWVTGDL